MVLRQLPDSENHRGAFSGAELRVIFSMFRFMMKCEDSLEVVLRAHMHGGICLAVFHTKLPIIIDTNCVQLVKAATTTSHDRSPYSNLVSHIN